MPFEPVILFFVLGLVAGIVRSDLKLPGVVYEALSIFLLLAIGLKGRRRLSRHHLADLALPALVIVAVALLIPSRHFRCCSGWVACLGPMQRRSLPIMGR